MSIEAGFIDPFAPLEVEITISIHENDIVEASSALDGGSNNDGSHDASSDVEDKACSNR